MSNNILHLDGRIECGHYLSGEYRAEIHKAEHKMKGYASLCTSTGHTERDKECDHISNIYYKLIQVTCPDCKHNSLIDTEHKTKFTEIPFQCPQCGYQAASLNALPNVHGWDDDPAKVIKILGAYRGMAGRRELLERKREPSAGGTDAHGCLPGDYERAEVDYELGHRYNRWPWPD